MKINLDNTIQSILENKEGIDTLSLLLQNPNATRKTRMSEETMKVLAYFLQNGLLYNGKIENLDTKTIQEACNVDANTVRRFMKKFGFDYKTDRITKKEDQSKSLGFIEKLYHEGSNSKFDIIATETFYNRLDELNIEYTRETEEENNQVEIITEDTVVEEKEYSPLDRFANTKIKLRGAELHKQRLEEELEEEIEEEDEEEIVEEERPSLFINHNSGNTTAIRRLQKPALRGGNK